MNYIIRSKKREVITAKDGTKRLGHFNYVERPIGFAVQTTHHIIKAKRWGTLTAAEKELGSWGSRWVRSHQILTLATAERDDAPVVADIEAWCAARLYVETSERLVLEKARCLHHPDEVVKAGEPFDPFAQATTLADADLLNAAILLRVAEHQLCIARAALEP